MGITNYTIENAKRAAVGFAEDSLSRGCLFVIMPDEDAHDDSKGDAETLSTLASLVVSDGVDGDVPDDAQEVVLAHLEEIFPDFA